MLTKLISMIQNDSKFKEMLRHSGVMYASGIISTVLIVIQQITTASIIGPADYGRLAAVLASGTLIMLLMDVRTWESGTKLLARPILDDDHTEIVRVISWLTLADLITGLAGVLVIVLLAGPIATHLMQAPELTWLVQLYAVSIIFRIIANGIARTVLRMYDRFDWLSIKSIIYSVSRIIFMSGPAFLGWGLQGIIRGAIVAEIIGASVQFYMQWRIHQQHRGGLRFFDFTKPRQFDEGVQMTRGLWLSATLGGLQTEMYIPILALLTSPEQVGLFRSGLDIAEMIEKLLMPFMLVLFPSIVKSYEQDTPANFIKLVKQSSLIMIVLTLPFVGGIILLGPIVFPRLLGAQYSGVSVIAGFIAVGFAVYGALMWTRPALVASNHIADLNRISIITTTLALFSLCIIVPTYAAAGSALIRGASLALQNIAFMIIFIQSWSPQNLPNLEH